MGRRNDHTRDELKAMAIAAAGRILEQDGLAALSARRVAKEIEYTVGTLYLVFKNFDELILCVNAETLDVLYAHMQEACQSRERADERVKALAHGYVRFAQSRFARWSMLFEHQRSEALPDWYQERVARQFAMVEIALAQLLGCSNDQIFVEARALWGGIHGICSLALADKWTVAGVESVDVVVDSLLDNFLRGLVRR